MSTRRGFLKALAFAPLAIVAAPVSHNRSEAVPLGLLTVQNFSDKTGRAPSDAIVHLDGVNVTPHTLELDIERGYIVRFVRDANGAIADFNGNIHRERVYGDVRLTFRPRSNT